jgi:hypothetical protein
VDKRKEVMNRINAKRKSVGEEVESKLDEFKDPELPVLKTILTCEQLSGIFCKNNKVSKNHVYPNEDRMEATAEMVQFQLKYWCYDWLETMINPEIMDLETTV